MHREKFPERIPFRLTRMLVNAMEVSGIEGNFRTTCENVMRVLRENKESLMAVLEAFVYDPLINWRLMSNPSPRQGKHFLHTSVRLHSPSIPQIHALIVAILHTVSNNFAVVIHNLTCTRPNR
jgi:phosphatidylinositol kinase/protein kinase (PI-3  family)